MHPFAAMRFALVCFPSCFLQWCNPVLRSTSSMNLSLSVDGGSAKRRSLPDFAAKQCHEDILNILKF